MKKTQEIYNTLRKVTNDTPLLNTEAETQRQTNITRIKAEQKRLRSKPEPERFTFSEGDTMNKELSDKVNQNTPIFFGLLPQQINQYRTESKKYACAREPTPAEQYSETAKKYANTARIQKGIRRFY